MVTKLADVVARGPRRGVRAAVLAAAAFAAVFREFTVIDYGINTIGASMRLLLHVIMPGATVHDSSGS